MLSALRRSIESKPSYQEIQENLLAGLTVGVIALPLSMALAIASGVAPQYGLYTAIIAGVVIALTGGGPRSMFLGLPLHLLLFYYQLFINLVLAACY